MACERPDLKQLLVIYYALNADSQPDPEFVDLIAHLVECEACRADSAPIKRQIREWQKMGYHPLPLPLAWEATNAP